MTGTGLLQLRLLLFVMAPNKARTSRTTWSGSSLPCSHHPFPQLLSRHLFEEFFEGVVDPSQWLATLRIGHCFGPFCVQVPVLVPVRDELPLDRSDLRAVGLSSISRSVFNSGPFRPSSHPSIIRAATASSAKRFMDCRKALLHSLQTACSFCIGNRCVRSRIDICDYQVPSIIQFRNEGSHPMAEMLCIVFFRRSTKVYPCSIRVCLRVSELHGRLPLAIPTGHGRPQLVRSG